MAGTTTSVDIASNALILLGDRAISSFTDGSTGADIASALYESSYHSLLTEYRWRFATKKALLARLSEKPMNDYKYAYQLPSDFLYLNSTDTRDFEIYGNLVYCDVDTLSIDYTYTVEEDMLPPYFIKALEFFLAMQFAIPLTGTSTRAAEYREAFNLQMKKARYQDSSQRPNRGIDDAPYLRVRNW